MEQLDLGGRLSYGEMPIKILDATEQVIHSKVVGVIYPGYSGPPITA
jgi:hypothetical protein